MKTIRNLLLCTLGLWLARDGRAATPLDFYQDNIGYGTGIDNLHQAGHGTDWTYSIALRIDITSINNQPVTMQPTTGFCIELAEDVGVGTWTNYSLSPLENAAAGRAGEVGTASSAIPAGGIGALAAARIRYLFDQHYASEDISSWVVTETVPTTHAFQLALWELSHDSDLSLTATTGSIYFAGLQSTTLQTNAVNLAIAWLNDPALAGVQESYQSQTWDVVALTSATSDVPGLGNQDMVIAKALGSQDDTTLRQLAPSPVPIPEPRAGWLALLGLAAARRRRRV